LTCRHHDVKENKRAKQRHKQYAEKLFGFRFAVIFPCGFVEIDVLAFLIPFPEKPAVKNVE
jgi:hypothetical protein